MIERTQKKDGHISVSKSDLYDGVRICDSVAKEKWPRKIDTKLERFL